MDALYWSTAPAEDEGRLTISRMMIDEELLRWRCGVSGLRFAG